MYWHKNCIKFFPHFRTSHFLSLLPCLQSSDMFGSDNRASSQKKPLTSFPSEVIHSFNSGKRIVQQFHGHTRCQEFQNVIFSPQTICCGNTAAPVVPVAALLLPTVSAGGQSSGSARTPSAGHFAWPGRAAAGCARARREAMLQGSAFSLLTPGPERGPSDVLLQVVQERWSISPTLIFSH